MWRSMDLLYAMAQAFLDFFAASPPLPWDFVAIFVGGYPVIMLHEAGHAVAARRLLDVDVEVTIGSVGQVTALQLGRVRAQLNLLATGAAGGSATFDAARATARDVLLIALAGPLASLAGVVVTACLLSSATGGTVWHGLLWGMTLGGCWGVLNVIPFTLSSRKGDRMTRSDGRLALDALQAIRAYG